MLGVLLHERLEEQDLHQRVRSFDVDSTRLEQDSHPVPGVGLDLMHLHGKAVGLLAAALLVEKIDECPARFRHGRVELERLAPARLGQVKTLLLILSFALEELHSRGLFVRAGPDGTKMAEGELRTRVGGLGGELSHEQMGTAVIGMHAQVAVEKRLGPLELSDPRECFDLIEAGRACLRPANSQGEYCDEGQHDRGQQNDQDLGPTINRAHTRNPSAIVVRILL